ncbi:MAG: exonuclease domain-containing protein, partial [Firmicutes bacterium]|nr:exonuclease domain-containing protein [Bacillota bacterium]
MEFIVCDLETTGLQPDKDKIIEIAIARVSDGTIVDSFTSLVNPQCGIPLKIQRLTGITEQQLDASPTWPEIVGQVDRFLTPTPLLGHNIDFDRAFLAANLDRDPFTASLDTLELARLLIPDASGHSLTALANQLELPGRGQHRAMDDLLTTIDLYLALSQRLTDLNMEVLLRLAPLLRQGESAWLPVIEAAGKNKVAHFSQEKLSSRVQLKEPAATAKPSGNHREQLQDLDIEALLGPQSPLAMLLPNYEQRQEQINMAAAVNTTLTDGKLLLAEASTGTGKSLAYLLPALLCSLRLDQRAVIATNTINLQEQLWKKDIPLLQKLFDTPFHAALLKGRSNYLCLRRFYHLLDSLDTMTPEEAKLAARILVWLQHTDSGDRAELNLYGPNNEVWQQLCSESESCLGGACRWYNRYCFVARARRSAENSHLLIINHALLFTDLTSEVKILPAHETLIIDEAHHLEDTATMHLGRKVSSSSVNQWLSLAGRSIKKLKSQIPPMDGQRWLEAISAAEKDRDALKENVATFFNCLAGVCTAQATGFSNNKFRLHTEKFDPLTQVEAEWQNLLYHWRGFLANGFKTVRNLLEEWTAVGEPWEEELQDFTSLAGQGDGFLADLLFIMGEPDSNYVYWLEIFSFTSQQSYVLHATPVDISRILFEQLFDTPRAIVLTSATMTVNHSFAHFMSRCGVNLAPPERVLTQITDSPFDYERQCLLYIADGVPAPDAAKVEDYLAALTDTIYQLVLDTGGRTMVLFTAHKTLRDVYYRLKPRLEESGVCLLGHNLDGGRGRLVD